MTFCKDFTIIKGLFNINVEMETDDEDIAFALVPFALRKGYGKDSEGFKIQSGVMLFKTELLVEFRYKMGMK